jgi:hypothetical protein
MNSLPFLNNIMATRTCSNCGHMDVKQQTVTSDGNGNKGQGFFSVSNQLNLPAYW